MASDPIDLVDPPASTHLKLLLFVLAGLVVPSAIAFFWPDFGWVGNSERTHRQSIEAKAWQDPWLPIDQGEFSSGWIRCDSLENAVKLDQLIDDGHLHSGKLVLSEGGLAWLDR